MKIDELAMGTTMMFLGATKFASMVKSLEDMRSTVESFEGRR